MGSDLRLSRQLKGFRAKLPGLVQSIDRIPELKGAGVAFSSLEGCSVLRKIENNRTYMIIEEQLISAKAGKALVADPSPGVIIDQSRFKSAYYKAGLDCTFASLALAGAMGGAAAAPVTAGATSLVTVALWTNAVTGAVQCANDIFRLYNEMNDPVLNDILDHNELYRVSSNTVELANVLSGIYLLQYNLMSSSIKYSSVKAQNAKPIQMLKDSLGQSRKARGNAISKLSKQWSADEKHALEAFSKRTISGKIKGAPRELIEPVVKTLEKRHTDILTQMIFENMMSITELGIGVADPNSYLRQVGTLTGQKSEELYHLIQVNISHH